MCATGNTGTSRPSAFADSLCVPPTASVHDAGGNMLSNEQSKEKHKLQRPCTAQSNDLKTRQSSRHQNIKPGCYTRSTCKAMSKGNGHGDQIPVYHQVHSSECSHRTCENLYADIRCLRSGCPQPHAKHSTVELKVCADRNFDLLVPPLKLYCSFGNCARKSSNPQLTHTCTPREWIQLHKQTTTASPQEPMHDDQAAFLQANPGAHVVVKHDAKIYQGTTLNCMQGGLNPSKDTHKLVRFKDQKVSTITLLENAAIQKSTPADQWNGLKTFFAGQLVLGENITNTCTLPMTSFVAVGFQLEGKDVECWKHVSNVKLSKRESDKIFEKNFDRNQLQLDPNPKIQKNVSPENLWKFKKGVSTYMHKRTETLSTANRPSSIYKPGHILKHSRQAPSAQVKSVARHRGRHLLNESLRACWSKDTWCTGYVYSYKRASNTYECMFQDNAQLTQWQVTLESAAVVRAIKDFHCHDEPTLRKVPSKSLAVIIFLFIYIYHVIYVHHDMQMYICNTAVENK